MTNDQIGFLIMLALSLLGLQAIITIKVLEEGIFERKWQLYLMCAPFSMYVFLVVMLIVVIWEEIGKIMNFNKIKQEFKKLK